MKVLGENCVGGVFGKAMIEWGPASIIKLGSGDDGFKLPEEGVFVKSCTVDKAEKKGIIQCFNNVNHVYAFGQDPESSRYSVTLGVFMQAPGCASEFKTGKSVAEIISEYRRMRVSERPQILAMTVDDGAVLGGILTGITVAVENAELNLFSITLGFTDLDAVE